MIELPIEHPRENMIIETKRLILRPFELADAKDVFEYLKRPMVNCFASMRLNSIEETIDMLKNRINETEYCFAIVLKESGKVIGEIEAYPEGGDEHSNDTSNDTFSPCWMINDVYQKKGYAYEAARAFLITYSK